VLATQDAELPPEQAATARARGLLQAVSPSAPSDEGGQWDLIVRRGPMHYGETPDFFTTDLIEELSAASYRRALQLQKSGRADEAVRRFNDAWRMEWIFPDVPFFLGYMAAVDARWAEAEALDAAADGLFERKLALAERYRALPDLVESIRGQAAESLTQHGVTLEKLGRRDEAAALYRRSLSTHPLAQTYYDLAVLAWGHDWAAAEENLSEAVRLDPNHAQARLYLDKLRAMRAPR